MIKPLQQIALMIKPLQQIALGTFTKGLPVDISKALVIKGCETLEDAYKEAVKYECKMEAKIIPDTRYRPKTEGPQVWDRLYASPRKDHMHLEVRDGHHARLTTTLHVA